MIAKANAIGSFGFIPKNPRGQLRFAAEHHRTAKGEAL
jgi:hypothetical protein